MEKICASSDLDFQTFAFISPTWRNPRSSLRAETCFLAFPNDSADFCLVSRFFGFLSCSNLTFSCSGGISLKAEHLRNASDLQTFYDPFSSIELHFQSSSQSLCKILPLSTLFQRVHMNLSSRIYAHPLIRNDFSVLNDSMMHVDDLLIASSEYPDEEKFSNPNSNQCRVCGCSLRNPSLLGRGTHWVDAEIRHSEGYVVNFPFL